MKTMETTNASVKVPLNVEEIAYYSRILKILCSLNYHSKIQFEKYLHK